MQGFNFMNLSIIKQIINLRRKTLLALAVVFSISLLLQIFISVYHEPKMEMLRDEWLKQREQEGRGVTLQSRDILYKNGLADLAKFRDRIYRKSNFAKFIGELYDIAAINSLELASITYKPSFNKEEQLLNYQLSLTVSGKYYQLKKFINDLGASANILVIDSISLASSGASADTVQLQIRITSYFKMEGQ